VTAPADEPTAAEAELIDAMMAAHPTWTARRYRDGWSIDWWVTEDDSAVLAWRPALSDAWKAAEEVLAYTREHP